VTRDPRKDLADLAAKTPEPLFSLGTRDLPEDVVKQELMVTLFLTTDNDNPRRGVLAYAVFLGGRENPDLTPDEVEYVTATLERGAVAIREHFAAG